MRHVLVARLDGAGDVLLGGPAVRAVAASGARVTVLAGPAGAAAARLLPGVDDVLVHAAPWVLADPPPVTAAGADRLVADLAARDVDEAVVLTSFHQSPLPLAMLLRLAGVPRISGASVDYPGSLLDVRLRPGETAHPMALPEDLPEPERALAIAAAAGFALPAGDDGRLAVRSMPVPAGLRDGPPYVVVHPGADAYARRWPAERHAAAVDLLVAAGWRVVVTGSPGEEALTAHVGGVHGGGGVTDLGGRTTLPALAGVLRGAAAVVVGNTAAAHLAAAVGTPVVSLFAPVVPAVRWRPYRVPHVLLGDQTAACAGSRARTCPIAGHPCLAGVTPARVVAAVRDLVRVGVPV